MPNISTVPVHSILVVMFREGKTGSKTGSSEPIFEIFTVLESGGRVLSIEHHIAFYRYYYTGVPVPDRYHRKVPVPEGIPSKFQLDSSNGTEMTHTPPKSMYYRLKSTYPLLNFEHFEFLDSLNLQTF